MALSRRLEQAYNKPGRKRKSGGKEWLHRVDVSDMLEVLEVSNVSQATADELLMSCPFPGHSSGDSKPSCYMNDGSKDKSKNSIWKCHGCNRAGNAITFYAEHQGISKQEAALNLRERYAPNFRAPIGGMGAEFERWLAERNRIDEAQEDMPTINITKYSELFGVDWWDAYDQYQLEDCPREIRYLFDRGFDADTLQNWDIGYDPISDRLTIPVCNEHSQIVGVKARTYKEKNEERIKYRILGDKEGKRKRYRFKHYEKSRVVFGLDIAILEGAKRVVLVEGELDVIALWMMDIPAISTGSAHLSEAQAILIRDNFDEVILMYDTNTAGIQASVGYYDKDEEFHPGIVQMLEPFVRVKVVDAHEDDAAKMMQDGREAEVHDLIEQAIPSHELDI